MLTYWEYCWRGGYVHHEQSNRVYLEDGLCPTIPTRYDHFMTGFKIAVYEQEIERNTNQE